MISFNDYRDKDGSINWGAYRKAQIAAGEICKKCGAYISILRSKGYPELCGDCRSMGEDFGEVTHDKYVRCPNCKC